VLCDKTNGMSVDINTSLLKNIDTFISTLETYNKKRPLENQRKQRDYDFLRDYYHRFIIERNTRALEVNSKEYKKIRDRARKLFPFTTLWNLCMDGRIKTVTTNGVTAGIGSSIRVPGGILREFVRDEEGKLMLLEDSNFARLLVQALGWGEPIAEVFDSHVTCAARKEEEIARGRSTTDSGLLNDITTKKEMLDAIDRFVEERYGENLVLGIQTSFDPRNGFMYMGLETEEALSEAEAYAKKHTTEGGRLQMEYTPEVLESLTKSGKIIWTQTLSQEEEIASELKKVAFTPKWTKQYVYTAEKFWEAIEMLLPKLTPYIEKKLYTIYPYLKKTPYAAEKEERVLLLLTNLFNGYLQNQDTYPFAYHKEEGISISKGSFPPYELSEFVVLDTDEKNLSINVELASLLVRSNRQEGRISDRSKKIQNAVDFTQAPVPLVVQNILGEYVDERKWKDLVGIDWSDMPKNWDKMSDREFFVYLETKGDMHLLVVLGINDLRHRMALLLDHDQIIASRLMSHHFVALPILTDKNRMCYMILPFVKHGFTQ
jgi:hypothetical protein